MEAVSVEIPLVDIKPNCNVQRKHNATKMEELAASIRRIGCSPSSARPVTR
jgi:ParB-like chromosome segregation protein Spo0J